MYICMYMMYLHMCILSAPPCMHACLKLQAASVSAGDWLRAIAGPCICLVGWAFGLHDLQLLYFVYIQLYAHVYIYKTSG